MIKLKISYSTPEELEKIIEYLKPITQSYKIAKNNVGKFKKAYANIIDIVQKK